MSKVVIISGIPTQISDTPPQKSKLPTHKPVAPPPEVKKPKQDNIVESKKEDIKEDNGCAVCKAGKCNAHTVIQNIKE